MFAMNEKQCDKLKKQQTLMSRPSTQNRDKFGVKKEVDWDQKNIDMREMWSTAEIYDEIDILRKILSRFLSRGLNIKI